ncbi:MAG: hypothetical protein HDR34_09875 [Treponema sp.]|nr:hypothetical protein [Treponema sp.]
MTEEKIIPWEELPITNTFMFNKVMTSDLDACRSVIETLLGIKISRIECVQDEKTLEVDALAKGVRFDVYVSNSTQVFDVELQMVNRGDLPMRARYYQSVADVENLNRGWATPRRRKTTRCFYARSTCSGIICQSTHSRTLAGRPPK